MKVKIPTFLDRTKMSELFDLLKPIEVVTNSLQGDQIQAPTCILQLCEMMQKIREVKCKYFQTFSSHLKDCLKRRLDKCVFGNRNFIIASILDPNQKLQLFQLKPEQQYKFGFSFVNSDVAKRMIRTEYKLLKPEYEAMAANSLHQRQNKKKLNTSKSIYSLLEENSMDLEETYDELEVYLREPKQNIDPVSFWQTNKKPSLFCMPYLCGICQFLVHLDQLSAFFQSQEL